MIRAMIIICVFCAGANFERFMQGGTDQFFGTQWILAVYAVAGLLIGWKFIPAVTSRHSGGQT